MVFAPPKYETFRRPWRGNICEVVHKIIWSTTKEDEKSTVIVGKLGILVI